jgi:Transposase DDE domain
MSDNLRRHRAITQKLLQLCPDAKGRQLQHLRVLSGLISGIVGARHTALPNVASKLVDGTKRESRVKRLKRLLQNAKFDHRAVFLPFAKALLASLAHTELVLVIDASGVGAGGMALVISVVYRGRALPLAWLVVKAKKGHLKEALHIRLLKQVQPLLPATSRVVFLGDGEFDGCRLLRRLEYYGWRYVCRTAKNSQLWLDERDHYALAKLAVQPGELISLPQVAFSKHEYGPVLAIAVWQKGYDEPLYLVSNVLLAEEAVFLYKKRFRIETFFSDQKSRGFHLDKSHLSDPKRLCRLMLGACLAYLWLVYLGTVGLVEGWNEVIHRTDRVDLSLFNLGLNLLEHFLNQLMPLPVAFVPLLLEKF